MYEEAFPLLQDTAPDLAAQSVVHRGIVATGLGDLDAAERYSLEGLALAKAAADPIGEFVARNWLANLARERGDFVASARQFASLLSDIGLSWPGELRERGRLEDASILLPGIAALLVATGRPEDAAILFGAGNAVRDEVGLALFLPERDLYERADATVDAALGADAAIELRASGSQLTPSEYADRAATALAAIIEGVPTPPAPTGDRGEPDGVPFSLTRRETEVLRLLAVGLTNAQLADRLSISPSTVSSHLERIFAKLNVTTRGAAVAIAHRLGIADAGS